MTDNMERNLSSNDEVDLLDIALTLWRKRLILVGAVLVSTVAGMLFASNQNVTYRGMLAIHPLNGFELKGFDSWNEAVFADATKVQPPDKNFHSMPNEALHSTPKKNLYSMTVTPDLLLAEFQSRYLRGDALNAALNQNSEAVRAFEGDDEERQLLLNSLRADFKLEIQEDGTVAIRFKTTDRAESVRILSSTMALISDNVKTDKLQSFLSRLEAMDLARQINLERLSTEIETYAQLYEARKSRSLTIMQEQAAIARRLGLENPVNALPNEPQSTGIINFERADLDPFESRYFLQGYRAIEKQIANLQQRTESENGALIKEADPLILERARLQAYNISEILKPLPEQVPLNDPDFRIVRPDTSRINFV